MEAGPSARRSSASVRRGRGAPAQGANTHSGAVLGTTIAKAARAVQPLVVALLALAIVLLALASLPRMAPPNHERATSSPATASRSRVWGRRALQPS